MVARGYNKYTTTAEHLHVSYLLAVCGVGGHILIKQEVHYVNVACCRCKVQGSARITVSAVELVVGAYTRA